MKNGTTFMEMLIVIVIIAVIASMGFSYYYKNREVTLGRGARSNLRIIEAAERIYRFETGSYWPINGSSGNVADINNALKVRLDATEFGYNITGSNSSSFSASADRAGSGGLLGCGGCLDCVYSVNQTGAVTNVSCP